MTSHPHIHTHHGNLCVVEMVHKLTTVMSRLGEFLTGHYLNSRVNDLCVSRESFAQVRKFFCSCGLHYCSGYFVDFQFAITIYDFLLIQYCDCSLIVVDCRLKMIDPATGACFIPKIHLVSPGCP